MFKPNIQYFVKTHLFDIISFKLHSCQTSFCLVKHSDFDYITGFQIVRTHRLISVWHQNTMFRQEHLALG